MCGSPLRSTLCQCQSGVICHLDMTYITLSVQYVWHVLAQIHSVTLNKSIEETVICGEIAD